MDFFENLLEKLGIDIEGISEQIDTLDAAKKNNDTEAYIAALHGLLTTLGESTENATPEIKKIKKEIIAILRPIIDVMIKDSLIGIYGYTEDMKLEAGKLTLETHKEMNKISADLIYDKFIGLVNAGLTRKEALEIVKAEIGKPQHISLSFSPRSAIEQGVSLPQHSWGLQAIQPVRRALVDWG